MIIVGELINASRSVIKTAIEEQDRETIQNIALDQFDAGATYIDVNAGVFKDDEPSYLKWLVNTVQSSVEAPCCIDSPNPRAIEAALADHKGVAMINSISLEKERYDNLLPLVGGTDLKVVALCMSDQGMPKTTDERLKIADKLVNGLLQHDVPMNNIYVDPLVQPISTDKSFGMEFLNAIEEILTRYDGIHTMCGLSNVSFGLPKRPLLNQTFMSMAIAKGLDGAIINPLDKRMMANIRTAATLAGKDKFCMEYLKAYRAGKLEV